MVLNNNKQIVADTEIAGLVARNRNLGGGNEVNLIITEVSVKNITNINGTVEITGGRVDLVMANKNRIVVNGGRFQNISRVTLIAGSLQMIAGDLVNIDIEEGNMRIGKSGADISNLTILIFFQRQWM